MTVKPGKQMKIRELVASTNRHLEPSARNVEEVTRRLGRLLNQLYKVAWDVL